VPYYCFYLFWEFGIDTDQIKMGKGQVVPFYFFHIISESDFNPNLLENAFLQLNRRTFLQSENAAREFANTGITSSSYRADSEANIPKEAGSIMGELGFMGMMVSRKIQWRE